MRYAALNQGMDYLTKFDDFLPGGENFKRIPAPEQLLNMKYLFASVIGTRYSDEQLYALALYLYSLEPPPNPNKFDALARRGKAVFENGRLWALPHAAELH